MPALAKLHDSAERRRWADGPWWLVVYDIAGEEHSKG